MCVVSGCGDEEYWLFGDESGVVVGKMVGEFGYEMCFVDVCKLCLYV